MIASKTLDIVATGVLVMAFGSIFMPLNGVDAASGWSDSAPVAITSNACESPSLVVDGTGKVHVVWAEDVKYANYASSSNRGFTWSAAETVASNSERLYTPFVSTDKNNDMHLVWSGKVTSGNYDIYYLMNVGTDVSNNSGSSTLPVIALDSQGRRRLLWADITTGHQQILYSGSDDGIIWSSTDTISAPTLADRELLSPDAAIDSDDNVHAVWHSMVEPMSVYYSKGIQESGSVTWSIPLTISGEITGSQYSKLVAKGKDLFVVWSRQISVNPGANSIHEVYFAKWMESGGWTTPILVPESRVEVSAVVPYELVSSNPDIAVDGAGKIHVVWHGKTVSDDKERVYYSTSSDGGLSWLTPINVSGDNGPSVKPVIGLDSGSIVYVAWQDYRAGGKSQIYFTSNVQRVFMPIVMRSFASGW